MKIYNTLSQQKEEFIPIEKNKVRMYVCGPTVYNYIHIGNARPAIFFDTVRRYFEYKGYEVNYVSNYTDVDDKIIKRANEEGATSAEIAERYIAEFKKDMETLNVHPATYHPKATEEIDDMIRMISVLIEKGHAYEKNGTVYFRTRSFSEYGKLSKQNIEDLEAGARIEVDDVKKNPMDFVLWKARKEGEIGWETPWGEGRPGWHIECSVMATKYLGETIDIHAGGQDLIFPHHENEIAQSEACTGKIFARYWMHNGYITIDNEKMSKSKGNFFTVRDILKEFDGETIRFFLLSAQYRNPINFSKELMEQAKNALERLYNVKKNLEHLLKNMPDSDADSGEKGRIEGLEQYKKKFIEAMDDDLNTADAIAAIFELAKEINLTINKNPSRNWVEKSHALLMELSGVLGLLNKKDEQEIDSEIQRLIEERQKARKEKNFALADKIRDQLREMGIILEDTPQGVRVIKKK